MKKLSVVFLMLMSVTVFAKNDCSKNDNFLQFLSEEFYHQVKIQMKGKQKLRDIASTVRLKRNQSVKIIDIDIIDDAFFQIYVEDEKENILPVITFYPKKGVDPYKATISDLEATGKFEVSCDMISYSEHTTALGKYYSDKKLRK